MLLVNLNRPKGRFLAFYFLVPGLLGLMCASLLLGYENYNLAQVWSALQHQGTDSLILWQLRLPRAVIAPLVGASLAVAGLLIQTLTRNPIAAPELIGMNAGAGLAVVVSLALGLQASNFTLGLTAFVGAGFSALLVYALASINPGQQSLLKLPLLGIALSMLFSAIIQAVLTLDETSLDAAIFWLAGGVSERGFDVLLAGFPMLLLGFGLCFYLAFFLDIFLLDKTLAANLSPDLGKVKALSFVAICSLTAASVTIAGPVVFVGLLAPQLSRLLLPAKHGYLLPGCALIGACLLTLADILARFVIYPMEAPVGAVTALIGAPVFIWYVLRVGVRS